MAYTIALSGKGGTGKTTLAALTVRYLSSKLGKAVLAVDADPNATLGLTLGVAPETTIADIREDAVRKRLELTEGMSKDRQIEYLIEQSIVEEKGFDLLSMGRPEGPDCYCYVNNLLRKYLDGCSDHYPFVVVDNEAGMEHLSRRTTNNVDLLLIVAEPTAVSLRSARRVWDLARDLPILVKKRAVVINKAPDPEIHPAVRALVDELDLDVAEIVPTDAAVYEAAMAGRTVLELPEDNPTFVTLGKLLDRSGVAA